MPKMNVLDKIVAAVAPRTAAKRLYGRVQLDMIQNSGYGNYGASTTKKSLNCALTSCERESSARSTECRSRLNG